ncbi:MAG: hypothetical protein ACR2KK_03555 [Acidimicrobiales bacterium]
MHVVRTAVAAPLLCAVIAALVWCIGLGAYLPATVAAAIVAAGLLGGAGWALWGNRRSRAGVAAALAAIGLGVASYAAIGKPFSQGRLRVEMGRLDAPDGFRSVAEEAGGNLLCFDTCSERTKSWFVPAGTATEARDAFAGFLRANGYSVTTAEGAVFADVRRGRLSAQVAIMPAEPGTGLPLGIPPGHFLGRLTLLAK